MTSNHLFNPTLPPLRVFAASLAGADRIMGAGIVEAARRGCGSDTVYMGDRDKIDGEFWRSNI